MKTNEQLHREARERHRRQERNRSVPVAARKVQGGKHAEHAALVEEIKRRMLGKPEIKPEVVPVNLEINEKKVVPAVVKSNSEVDSGVEKK